MIPPTLTEDGILPLEDFVGARIEAIIPPTLVEVEAAGSESEVGRAGSPFVVGSGLVPESATWLELGTGLVSPLGAEEVGPALTLAPTPALDETPDGLPDCCPLPALEGGTTTEAFCDVVVGDGAGPALVV